MSRQVDKGSLREQAEDLPPLPEDDGEFTAALLCCLDHLEQQHAAGDSSGILEAIALCARHDLPLPQWVSVAYLKAYDAVKSHGARSWDDVFGAPHAKGVHLEQSRLRRAQRFAVLATILEIRHAEPSTPICPALFERVALQCHVSPSQANKLWDEGRKLFLQSGRYKKLLARNSRNS